MFSNILFQLGQLFLGKVGSSIAYKLSLITISGITSINVRDSCKNILKKWLNTPHLERITSRSHSIVDKFIKKIGLGVFIKNIAQFSTIGCDGFAEFMKLIYLLAWIIYSGKLNKMLNSFTSMIFPKHHRMTYHFSKIRFILFLTDKDSIG